MRILIMGLCLLVSLGITAQPRTITGKITDASRNPLAGATVSASKSGTTVASSQDGNFSIVVTGEDRALTISMVGYETYRLNLGSATDYSVQLQTSNTALSEVVVVGYGTAKRTSLTGSVGNVAAKELDQRPVSNTGQLLQGKSPGLQVSAVNGRPGQSAFIRVRGIGSISAGNEPLIVIDGVPANGDQFTANRNNEYRNNDILGSINPNDIESISVLKDASASSIYGSRASNGVILITTKKGKSGKAQFSFRNQFGIKQAIPFNYDLMNAREKLEYEYSIGFQNTVVRDTIRANFGASATLFNITDVQRQQAWDKIQEFNWVDRLFRNGKFRSHEVAVSGADERFRYLFSLQKFYEEGIFERSQFDRLSGRLNLEYKATKWLTIGQNLTMAGIKEQLIRDRNNVQGPFRASHAYNSYEPEFLPNGSYNLTHQGFSLTESLINQPEDASTVNALGNLYGEVKLSPEITIRSSIGANFSDFKREYLIKPGSILDQFIGNPAAPGSKTDNGNRNFNYVFTNTAQFAKQFADMHDVSLLVGSEYTENRYSEYSLQSEGFPSPQLTTQNTTSNKTNATTGKQDWTLFSLFSRARYAYDNRYFAEGSIRRDGSSRFGDNNRYGTFWAVGAGWNIHNEKFFRPGLVSELKLRASYGTSGNFEIGNYSWQGLYLFTRYNGQATSYPGQLANPDLSWEKNNNFDIGLDFALFKRRISGTIDYYNRKTFDLLLFRPLSRSVGFTSRLENVGDMENKGIEISLTGVVVRKKDFELSSTITYTRNKNKITRLIDNQDIQNPAGLLTQRVGEPIDVFRLVRWAGVDPADGAPMWYNLNGQAVKNFSTGYEVVLSGKSPDPRWFGNFNLSARYKIFELNANFYYSGGNYIYNSRWQALVSDGDFGNAQQARDALDHWKKPGDVTSIPRPVFRGGLSQISDRFLEKGDYVRLRDLTLSVNYNSELLQKIHLKGIRFYVSGQNLFTITKFKGDPEVGIGITEANATNPLRRQGAIQLFSFPNTRAITAGLDINF